jgi:hypothetical protein
VNERRLVVVRDPISAPAPADGTTVLVLDPTWTPMESDRPDLLAARRITGDVIDRIDVFGEARAIVDSWAVVSGIADALTVEGTTYWFRLRETMWRWVHERRLWRSVIAVLEADAAIDDVELTADDPALVDVLRAHWPSTRIAALEVVSAADTNAAARSVIPPPRDRLARLLGRVGPSRATATPADGSTAEERRRREAILASRVASLAGSPRRRIVILTNPGTHQRIGGADGDRLDPLFGAVIPGLAERGDQPVLLATGLDQRRDDDWTLIADDERLLPQFLLRTRWSRPEDDPRSAAAVAAIDAVIERARATPILLDGLDLTTAFVDALRASAAHIVGTDVQMLARIERFLEELEPRAILLAQEGIRTPWLMAGSRAGLPVVAVQHGVLYAGHAGYPNVRHHALCLPARTCVYGPYERDALLEMGYRSEEVEVTGSPRLDLAGEIADTGMAAAQRRAVRNELGVADSDRLLVISTLNLRFVQDTHFAHMLEVVLGGPLPGTHLVFKLHPGERDAGPYQELLLGLARAGGYVAPPMTVIKDIDLYRLLRAADAHLGLLSTVLTEAVVVGTPNLIAMTGRLTDLLGYVAAGVATPVRSPADVRAALADLRPAELAARATFLARHFRPGDASGRIIDTVDAAIDHAPTVASR